MKFNIWEYEKKPLTSLLNFIVDNRGKTVPTSENGHILIATNCVTNDNLYPTYEKVRYLSDNTYNTFFRAHPIPGDILFVNKGTPGKVCMVPDPVDFCIAQDMIAFRTIEKVIYNKYLFAILRSNSIQMQIANTSVGDVIPHFKKQFLDQIMVPVAPKKIQKFIGDLYFNFCAKMDRNNKTNVIALNQCLAIYKNFIADKGVNGTLGDLIIEEKKSKIKVAQARGVKGKYPFYTSGKAVLEYDSYLVDGSYIYLNTGGTADVKYFQGKSAYSTDTWCVFGANDGTEYLYLCLLSMLKEIELVCFEGSALKHLQKAKLKTKEIYIPTTKEMNTFNEMIRPLLSIISHNYVENKHLIEMRDTIVPKIMSGEIDVTDLDI